MTPFLWSILLISLGALSFGLYALLTSREVDRFASSTQNRLNGVMDKFTRMESRLDTPNPVSNKGWTDRVERELFRQGAYPDLGLREWCRAWRLKLRNAVSSLESRVDQLEVRAQVAANPVGKIGREEWDARDARIKDLETTMTLLLHELKLQTTVEAVEEVPIPTYTFEPRLVRVSRRRRRG